MTWNIWAERQRPTPQFRDRGIIQPFVNLGQLRSPLENDDRPTLADATQVSRAPPPPLGHKLRHDARRCSTPEPTPASTRFASPRTRQPPRGSAAKDWYYGDTRTRGLSATSLTSSQAGHGAGVQRSPILLAGSMSGRTHPPLAHSSGCRASQPGSSRVPNPIVSPRPLPIGSPAIICR